MRCGWRSRASNSSPTFRRFSISPTRRSRFAEDVAESDLRPPNSLLGQRRQWSASSTVSNQSSETTRGGPGIRAALGEATAARAFESFSEAFGRWRQLYLGARAQLEEANRKSEMRGLPAEERKEAKIRQAQANEQIMLLGTRKFLGERRLLLIPLSRNRRVPSGVQFPAPAALRVHSLWRIQRRQGHLPTARALSRHRRIWPGQPDLPRRPRLQGEQSAIAPDSRTADGRLVTKRLYVCNNCGAAHAEETERCIACDNSMGAVRPISNVLRIDNVETEPAERITANDEERQRQGFEIQTVFAWSVRDGASSMSRQRLRETRRARSSRSTTPRARK